MHDLQSCLCECVTDVATDKIANEKKRKKFQVVYMNRKHSRVVGNTARGVLKNAVKCAFDDSLCEPLHDCGAHGVRC